MNIKKNSQTPIIMILTATLAVLLNIIFVLNLIDKLTILSTDFGTSPSFFSYLSLCFLPLIPLPQLIYGLNLFKKQRLVGKLENHQKNIGITIFFVTLLVYAIACPVILMISVLWPASTITGGQF